MQQLPENNNLVRDRVNIDDDFLDNQHYFSVAKIRGSA